MAMRSSQPRELHARELELETDARAWHALVLDRLQSLRTAVAIVTVVALAALGVAVWALLRDDGGGTRRQSVSVARVARPGSERRAAVTGRVSTAGT